MPPDQGHDEARSREAVQVSASILGADAFTATESGRIDVYMSGALVQNIRRLASMAGSAPDPQDVTCLCISAVLMAAAALEALLTDLAHVMKPAVYNDRQFRRSSGVPEKYRRLFGGDLSKDHPAVARVWEDRNAVGHSEAEEERSRRVGARLNPASALGVANSIEDFARTVWGSAMPDWFRADAGL